MDLPQGSARDSKYYTNKWAHQSIWPCHQCYVSLTKEHLIGPAIPCHRYCHLSAGIAFSSVKRYISVKNNQS